MTINADDFIFHIDLVPLSVPIKVTGSLTGSSSLTNGQTKITRGPWIDTAQGTLALQANITIDNMTMPDYWQEYQYVSGISTCYANIRTEMNTSNQVRIVIEEYNQSGANRSFTPKTVNVQFNMYHIV